MRISLILLLSFFSVGNALAESSIRIGEDTYVLAYKADGKEGSLNEFVRPPETVDTWTTLVGVRIFGNLNSPKKYIATMAADYQAKFPLNKFAMFENKETGSWVIDFIIFPTDANPGVIEWNYFVAEKNQSGKGIRVNQFAARRKVVGSVDETLNSWNLGAYRKSLLPVLMKSHFDIVEKPDSVR